MRLAQIQNRMSGVMVEKQRRDEYKRMYFSRKQFISARVSNGVGVYLCIKTRSLAGQ